MKEGVINILKAPGMTSSNVVCDVKKIIGVRRVGHTGTLDPGAAGVLPVCVGRATRLFDYLVDKNKEYVFEIKFGVSTDTLDAYGVVDARDTNVNITLEDILRVKEKFVGAIDQLPPMYSAINFQGQKLYDLARKGRTVEVAPRTVNVYAFDVLRKTAENTFIFRVECSRGTYVRVLAKDLAKALGTVAYVSFLLRTGAGQFALDTAVSVNELREAALVNDTDKYIIPTDVVLSFLEEIRIYDNHRARQLLTNGAQIHYNDAPCGELLRVYCDDYFIGIGEMTQGDLRIKTLFD